MKVLLLFDRLICKIKKEYRKKLFKIKIKCEHNDFSIVGDIILINKNIRIGQGVTIYPGVMFFGDGIIEIGDNVDIGKDTIFYSSAKNGGIKIGANTMIAAQCYIIDTDHGTKRSELNMPTRK